MLHLIRILIILVFSISIAVAATAPLGVYRGIQNNLTYLQPMKTSNFPNKIGFSQEEDYVSDLKTYWSYSSLSYYRETQHGIFGARFNRATRYATGGVQYQLEAYPQLNENTNLALIGAYSHSSQLVYPNYQYLVEPYFNLSRGFEASIGERYTRSFNTNIYTYTASFGKNIGNYFIYVRPYYYDSQDANFFEVGIKRYFENNSFISLKLGTGKVPDIGDLPPFNQIIVYRASTINVDGEYRLCKRVGIRGSIGYARQKYAGGNIRDITSGAINLSWNF